MTRRTCIAIVDATRARILVHERSDQVNEMTERVDLVNGARRATNVASTRTRGDHFGFDAPRTEQLGRLDTLFAHDIVAELSRIAGETSSRELVLSASPHMLGLLREPLSKLHGVRIMELVSDLTKLDRDELRERLSYTYDG